jgi:hypothetical protein
MSMSEDLKAAIDQAALLSARFAKLGVAYRVEAQLRRGDPTFHLIGVGQIIKSDLTHEEISTDLDIREAAQ